jgi:hypothetical protein
MMHVGMSVEDKRAIIKDAHTASADARMTRDIFLLVEICMIEHRSEIDRVLRAHFHPSAFMEYLKAGLTGHGGRETMPRGSQNAIKSGRTGQITACTFACGLFCRHHLA